MTDDPIPNAKRFGPTYTGWECEKCGEEKGARRMEGMPARRYWCHRCLSAVYLEQVLVSPLTLRCPNCGERLGEVTDGSVVWIPMLNEIRVDGVVQTTQSRDQWWEAFVAWLESRNEDFTGKIGGRY